MALEVNEGVGGLMIYTDTISTAQTADINMLVRTGSVHEPDELAGIAHALEHCVHLETDTFPDRQSLRDFDGEHGIASNANTFYTRTVYYGHGPDVEPIFHRLGQVLFHTKFPGEPVAHEMRAIRREASTGMDDDQQLHFVAADNVAFGEPHGRRVIGYHDKLDFSPEQLRAYYNAHYQLGNMALVAVGNITSEQAQLLAARFFDPKVDSQTPLAKARPLTKAPTTDIASGLVREHVNNLHYLHSYHLRDELLAQYQQHEVLYEIAMRTIGARCFQKLRLERGISYDGGAFFSTSNHPDAWTAKMYVTTDPEHAGVAEEVFDEVATGGGDTYSDKELRAAHGRYRGAVLRDMDSADARTSLYLSDLQAGVKPTDLAEHASQLRATGLPDIRAAIDNIVAYFANTPKVAHKTGRREDLQDLDEYVDISSII